MWWLIIPGVLLIVMICLLFAPIVIDIDSTTGWIAVRYGRMAAGALVLNEEELVVRVRALGWKKEYDLMALAGEEKKTKQVERARRPKADRRRKMDAGKMFRKIRGVLRSFRVERCEISIDTGNMPLNGVLYPWVYLLRLRSGKNISINFSGEETVILRVRNTVARMLWAFIKS